MFLFEFHDHHGCWQKLLQNVGLEFTFWCYLHFWRGAIKIGRPDCLYIIVFSGPKKCAWWFIHFHCISCLKKMQPLLISLAYVLLLPWLCKSILQDIFVMKICFTPVVCPTYLCTIIKTPSDFFSSLLVKTVMLNLFFCAWSSSVSIILDTSKCICFAEDFYDLLIVKV